MIHIDDNGNGRQSAIFERKRTQDQHQLQHQLQHQHQYESQSTSSSGHIGEGGGGGGGKRIKIESSSSSSSSSNSNSNSGCAIEHTVRRKTVDATTPTDRALKLVRVELARREEEIKGRKSRERGRERGRGVDSTQCGEHPVHLNAHDPRSRDNDRNRDRDRDREGEKDRERDNGIISFDLLTFFKYLDSPTQR